MQLSRAIKRFKIPVHLDKWEHFVEAFLPVSIQKIGQRADDGDFLNFASVAENVLPVNVFAGEKCEGAENDTTLCRCT